MRLMAVLLTGVLSVVVLFEWACDTNTNAHTGSKGAPCTSNSECGGGLLCAVGRCSDGSAGEFCSTSNDCVDDLICTGRGTCGGVIGSGCGAADSICDIGLICALVEDDHVCVSSDGSIGSACRVDGHCTDDLVCDEEMNAGTSTCRIAQNNPCTADSACAGNLICAQVGSELKCTSSDGSIGSACRVRGHCTDDLVCDTGTNTCRVAENNACTADSACADGLLCAGMSGSQVCTQPNRAVGGVCRNNGHCTDPLICDTSTDTCRVARGGTCTADDMCTGDLLCAGAPGAKVCTQPNRAVGGVCRNNGHCTDPLICDTSTDTCRVAQDGTCTADDMCTGDLLCAGQQVRRYAPKSVTAALGASAVPVRIVPLLWHWYARTTPAMWVLWVRALTIISALMGICAWKINALT